MTPGEPLDADALVSAFTLWAAGHRSERAVSERSRERWLRQQATETATLAGILVDLAEKQTEVSMLLGANTAGGRLVGVGQDCCVVVDRGGAATIVAVAHLGAVRVAGPRGGTEEASGQRPPPGTWTLVDALAVLATERSPARLALRGGEVVSGTMIASGTDVVTVRLPATALRVHIPIGGIETCTPG